MTSILANDEKATFIAEEVHDSYVLFYLVMSACAVCDP